jgi:uncharacterized protein YfaS (alpha-2-macroglobulin family)
VKVSLNGQSVLELTDPKDLSARVFRLHLRPPDLPLGGSAKMELIADCKEPIRYALNASGFLRTDRAEPAGDALRLTRGYWTTEGIAHAGAAKAGTIREVRLSLKLDRARSHLIVEDRRPSGWEYAGEELRGSAAKRVANVEFRDDRVCAFFTSLPPGTHELVYYLRAETPGTSHVLPGRAYAMYDEKTRGETGADVLEILPDKP